MGVGSARLTKPVPAIVLRSLPLPLLLFYTINLATGTGTGTATTGTAAASVSGCTQRIFLTHIFIYLLPA